MLGSRFCHIGRGVVMKRELTEKLIEWKDSSYRKPLILRGKRQVGKTWLLRTFGNTYYDNVAYLNFEKDQTVHSFFKRTKDAKELINTLSIYLGFQIEPLKTLIIFLLSLRNVVG